MHKDRRGGGLGAALDEGRDGREVHFIAEVAVCFFDPGVGQRLSKFSGVFLLLESRALGDDPRGGILRILRAEHLG